MAEGGAGRDLRRLAEVRRSREKRAVSSCLWALGKDAQKEGQNLMGPILEAVREYATLQEMMDVLRDAWGVYEEPVIL